MLARDFVLVPLGAGRALAAVCPPRAPRAVTLDVAGAVTHVRQVAQVVLHCGVITVWNNIMRTMWIYYYVYLCTATSIIYYNMVQLNNYMVAIST
jgi:hypothetical protein